MMLQHAKRIVDGSLYLQLPGASLENVVNRLKSLKSHTTVFIVPPLRNGSTAIRVAESTGGNVQGVRQT